jgi:hypothetical protein
LENYTSELPGLVDDIGFVFDRDITLAASSGITVKRADNNALVSGVSAAVAGNTLAISHDALIADTAYIVVIAASALTGDSNGEGNGEIRRLVFAGSSELLDANFDTGTDCFDFARTWFTPAETWWQVWRRSDGASIGPNADSRFLLSRTNWTEDFAVSPMVSLSSATQYTVDFRASLERSLNVGYVPASAVPGSGTAADVIAAITHVGTVSSGGSKTVRFNFTPAADGDYHIIFYSGAVSANADQQIDAITLTRSINPVVSFITPGPEASFRESDNVTVEVEAYGISAPISKVELFDDEVLLGEMTLVGDRYTYAWNYHAPGSRTLRAVATDSLGNTAVSDLNVTITFDDGSTDPFLGWDFDDGQQGWTFSDVSDSWMISIVNSPLKPGKSVRVWAPASQPLSISSPQVFLFAGETYTLQFDAMRVQTTGSFGWLFLATTVPGFPADFTGRINYTINSDTWKLYEISFTVPADGPYYLTFFYPSTSGYPKVVFDDVRIFGNLNSVPSVALTQPGSSVSTIGGATLNLAATATDVDGTIVSVDFRTTEGALVAPDAIDLAAPYSYQWTDLPEGTFHVMARATDNASAVIDSSPRTIKVAPNQYSISTYIGDAATDDTFTGGAYLSDGTLVLGGIMDPALFPGATPVYLNGSSVGDRGVVARLSEDGRTVLSVAVVGARVLDIDTDDSNRIFVAAGADGAVVLNSSADQILWANSYGAAHVHRIDAAPGGTFAFITSSTFDYLDERISSGTNYVLDTNYNLLGTMGGVGAYTTDVAVDEFSQTVVFIGWKNITDMQDDSAAGINPVDIPGMVGRSFDGTLKWRAYDWEKQESGERWLNLITNNMADTRGNRVIISRDGKLYAGMEFDGGNTPLRYDPFDVRTRVAVVGGDQFHSMSNTSTVPKTFVGRYDPGTGSYQTGQWITNRTSTGGDNTIRIKNGNLLVDSSGRVHVVGGSASGLPLSHDPLPGIGYNGGAFHLVYSPDLASREYVTRLTLSTGSALSHYAAIAESPDGKVAIAGNAVTPSLFTSNPWQAELAGGYDAHFAVADPNPYYKFQTGVHPRLFFDAAELETIRARMDQEPYASMLAYMIEQRDFGDAFRPHDPTLEAHLVQRAQASAFIYALTGDETYAADARSDIEAAWALIGNTWASSAVKGLTLYARATRLATAYDLCASSEAWDPGFNYAVSKRLVEIATVIVTNGGTEQPNDLGSNWHAARGSSGGIALLATDHTFDTAMVASSHQRASGYLNTNQGTGATRGWNPEGVGYTAYAIGSFLGPYAIAAKRNAVGDLTQHTGLQWMPWTGFVGATSALNVYGFGGVKTDWSDDNAHVGGEGIYGMAFAFAPPSLLPGLRHAYDRFMGSLSPYGANWDAHRAGTFWSILYYPADIPAQDPTEIWDWHRGSDDSNGLGVFTFRNAYQNRDDILVQFKARLKAPTQSHDGPDGLGFRIIGLGAPFAIGGGRDLVAGELNQATVYPSNPDVDVTRNSNTGSLIGTPLIKPDGGGHTIASMATNNVGTTNHKRWFVTDYDSVHTGAEAVIIVADSSSNGTYWQIPTFIGNTVTSAGNTFTISGANGATLQGTILHPGASPVITIGTKARGSRYAVHDVVTGNYNATLAQYDANPVDFPLVTENRYLHIQGNGDGDFLVVMTMVSSGTHPAVTRTSGTVADAVITVGTKNYALNADNVLYSSGGTGPLAYVAPHATVTFDADGKGTLGGAAVQTVAYGADAIAPVVSANSGHTFIGWDKAFDRIVKSMTVTALYESFAQGYDSWVADHLAGLTDADRLPGANPDGDLYVNLLEYAFALNPALSDGAEVIRIREEAGSLVLAYRVRNDASDITVTPFSGSDLSGQGTAIPQGNISVTGSGTNFTEYEAVMLIGSGPLFLWLQVTQQ